MKWHIELTNCELASIKQFQKSENSFSGSTTDTSWWKQLAQDISLISWLHQNNDIRDMYGGPYISDGF